MEDGSPGESRCALVFGPPGTGVMEVADELARLLDHVDAWDGSEPWPSGDLLELADAGRWPLIVRTEARESYSLRRLLAAGQVDSLGAALQLIELSRDRQSGMRVRARVVLDVSQLGEETLRARVRTLLEAGLGQRPTPIVVLESFAYPRGVPLDLDWCWDARALRNPYWEEALRPLSGMDLMVQQFVLQQPLAKPLVEGLELLVLEQMAAWSDQGRQTIRLGIGCTGGFHRSVALCEELWRRLSQRGFPVVRWHREIGD